MTKELLNVEVINLVQSINRLITNTEKVKELPIKIRWAIKKNINTFSPTVKVFEDLRRELIDELQKDFFNEEKSHVITAKDNVGNDEEVRQVNDECMDEYNERVNELNSKLQELLSENNEYEIYTVNMDEFVEGLPDDTKLEYDDIDILSFMGKE